MLYFDLLLLLVASFFAGSRLPLVGVTIFVLGGSALIQNLRTRRLLGSAAGTISTGKKIKSGVIAIVLGGLAAPLLDEFGHAQGQQSRDVAALMPLVILVGVLSASLLIALINERKKR